MVAVIKRITQGLCLAGVTCALSLGYTISHEYLDVPSFPEYCKKGRQKNVVAQAIAIITDCALCQDATSYIDFKLKKTFFPTAHVKGCGFIMFVDQGNDEFKYAMNGACGLDVIKLSLKDGNITGVCQERGMLYWDIQGTYDKDNVHIDVTIPDSLGLTLEGRIIKRD